MKTLEQRVLQLEAENKELRRLWIENEGDIITQKVRVDELSPPKLTWFGRFLNALTYTKR